MSPNNNRGTGLALKYPRMTTTKRDAVLQLTWEIIEGTAYMQLTAAGLKELLAQRGVAEHFRRRRGNW